MPIVIMLELDQLRFQIYSVPKQRVIQVFAANRSNQSFNERMRYRHVWHGFDFSDAQDSKVSLPLMEAIQRIMIGTQVFGSRLSSNRSIEHATQCHTIDDAGADSESDNPTSVLIHDHKEPNTS